MEDDALDKIAKEIIANEAGIKSFDQLINEFEIDMLKGLSQSDAADFANWYLDSGFDREGKARAWLNANTDRLADPRMVDDDTSFSMEQQGFDEVAETNKAFELEAEQSNADLAPEKVAEEPDVPKGKKLLSILKWLDPVEEGIAGALTKVGLTGTAATYAIAEASNFIGNLIFEGLRSQADIQMINSKILTGKATDEEVKELNDKIIKNFKSGTQRAAKISPAANVTDWIGKMLDR
tara:strand:+ start:6298 stop:7008 length:711 start_codon:yes stop_codon:yes gene_type:complete